MAFVRRTSTTSPTDITTLSYFTDSKYGGTYAVSTLGTSSYQCTYWALQRSCEIAKGHITYFTAQGMSESDADKGPIFTNQGFHDAQYWATDVNTSSGWQFGTSAKIGAIMVYGTNWGSGHGHVRVVEAIDEDNDILYFSGGNEDNAGTIAFSSITPIPTGNGTDSTGLKGYLYNPYADFVDITDTVTRDTSVNQCKVLVSTLKVRTGPGTSYDLAGSVSHFAETDGIYNVLEVVDDGTYNWYRIADRNYIADPKDNSWVEYYQASVSTVGNLYIGSHTVTNAVLGTSSSSLQSIYLGPNKLWPPNAELDYMDYYTCGPLVTAYTPSTSGYRYGPSILKNSDGTMDIWWSSPGVYVGPESEENTWDYIRYQKRGTDGSLSAESIVLKPTAGTDDHYSCCDPGVIYFDGYYYLAYTSTKDSNQVNNELYVARSTSPTGTYEKWSGTDWGNDPKAIITYPEQDGAFGVGEGSFVIYNNKLYLYYTKDTLDSEGGAHNYTYLATAPLVSDWPAHLTLVGKVMDRVIGEDSVDVAYLDDLNTFIAFCVYGRMTENSNLETWQSADGIKWTKRFVSDFAGMEKYASNCGVSKSATGHISSIYDEAILGYGYAADSSALTKISGVLRPVRFKHYDEDDTYAYDYVYEGNVSELDVLYTADTHESYKDNCAGNEAYAGDSSPQNISLQNFSDYKDRLETSGIPTVCVDCGDIFHGGYYNTSAVKREIANFFNRGAGTKGYNKFFATYGNHEFYAAMGDAEECFSYLTWIDNMTACNLKRISTGDYPFPGYRVVKVGDVKIGFIGIGYPSPNGRDDNTEEDVHDLDDLRFYDAVRYDNTNPDCYLYQKVQQAINYLKNTLGCMYVIAFTHMDKYSDEDYDADGRFNARADLLIEATNGLDCVLPGHLNISVDNQYYYTDLGGRRVFVAREAGSSLNTFGRLRLKLDGSGITNTLISSTTNYGKLYSAVAPTYEEKVCSICGKQAKWQREGVCYCQDCAKKEFKKIQATLEKPKEHGITEFFEYIPDRPDSV